MATKHYKNRGCVDPTPQCTLMGTPYREHASKLASMSSRNGDRIDETWRVSELYRLPQGGWWWAVALDGGRQQLGWVEAVEAKTENRPNHPRNQNHKTQGSLIGYY